MIKTVLIIGSAPDALGARDFDCEQVSNIVAVNNAWQVREDWDHVVYPEDFAQERRRAPARGQTDSAQTHVTHTSFVPANNAYGGIIYAGATMAYTAGYWALHQLKPDILAFVGCDMMYESHQAATHFYGNGEPDPLRDDPTLYSLEAKSNRLMWLAGREVCLCVNLSEQPMSRLTFPRLSPHKLAGNLSAAHEDGLRDLEKRTDAKAAQQALKVEQHANCFVETGDYWNHPYQWDAEALKNIDEIWLSVFPTQQD